MPTATVELPRDMVDAVSSYAERSHRSISDLFANALKMAYGIDSVYVFRKEPKASAGRSRPPLHAQGSRVRPVARHSRNADDSWLDEIHPKVRELVGIVSLPADKSDDELIYEAIMDKYNRLK